MKAFDNWQTLPIERKLYHFTYFSLAHFMFLERKVPFFTHFSLRVRLELERKLYFFERFRLNCKSLPWKEQAETLRHKLWTFAEATKTRKRLSLTLLTTYGLNRNVNSSGLVETVLRLEDLYFE